MLLPENEQVRISVKKAGNVVTGNLESAYIGKEMLMSDYRSCEEKRGYWVL